MYRMSKNLCYLGVAGDIIGVEGIDQPPRLLSHKAINIFKKQFIMNLKMIIPNNTKGVRGVGNVCVSSFLEEWNLFDWVPL